jgi:hypothetical protein
MHRIFQVMGVVVVSLGLSLAVVGCSSGVSSEKDKMSPGNGKDKMSNDKMSSDKMGNGKDKMSSDKMSGGKMEDKMGDKK